ncbi:MULTISPECIES: hypothetical protein [unclassified Thioalkalivibrio]|uniref:hypothetical protein n=1 Tax=unclassified Thioalkalivibrio TaxID=2621013 RepID=UPI00037CF1D7|nr:MULTISPECIES: hypothetical protein [unclassified Thioalkalivibrio]
MILDAAAIRERLPHAGAMSLLDEVVAHDADRIHCRARSHRDPDNPLRSEPGLHALAALEYGAQAMAVHGSLGAADAAAPRAGYLAAVRDLRIHARRLDTIETALDIHAERVMADARSSIYDLAVEAAGEPLLAARATVILEPGETP